MSDTIEFYRSEDVLMNDSIDRIIVEIHTYKKKYGYKSILLSGCSSESGTTTLAINLAIALSMSGWRTLLIDCDLRKKTKYKRLTEQVDTGLSDYLDQKIEKKNVIYETNYDFLEYVPSGSTIHSPVHLLSSSKMEDLTLSIKQEYDYVLFDIPSLNIVSDANILFPYIDGIILVAALQKTTKKQLKDARRKVDRYREKYYGLIVNNVDFPQFKKYIKDYDYFKETNLTHQYTKNIKKKLRKKDKG